MTMLLRRRVAGLGLLALLGAPATATAQPADADTPDLAPWAVAGFDLGLIGTMTVASLSGDLDDGRPSHPAALTAYAVTPIALMVGGAFLADRADLQARGGHAIHGGAWGAALGGAIGVAIESGTGASARAGTTTAALTLIGTALGAGIGALVIPGERTSAAWLIAPMVGGLAGIMVGGFSALFGATEPVRGLTVGAATGIAGGLAVGGTLAWRGTY
jgi:hypothetical protein